MKATLEERIRYRLLRLGRKGPVRRGLAILGMFFCVVFFHFVHYIRDNKKRLAMVMMSMVLFAAYASFSFPIFADSEEWKSEKMLASLISDETVSLVQEKEVSVEDLENLEEGLLQDGYEVGHMQDAEEEHFNLEDILSYRMEQGESAKPTAEPPKQADPGETVFSRDDWRLILVNKQHPIPEDYTFALATIKGSKQCDERIIDDLLAMMQAAREEGFNLLIKSPYRSDARQEWLFEKKINLYMGRGLSYMDAYKLSSQIVMVPDSSEHQIGLALDIVSDYYDNLTKGESLTEGFGDTEAGIWLREHCAEYGFILRYPEGKEYITSVEYEPWHFRYVGVEAATVIMDREITLEEFVEELE